MMPQVVVFSDKVGRGKTTFLKHWLKNRKTVGGVLSPKMDGKRYFELISSGEFIPMETETATMEIGKFRFDSGNFKRAEKTLWDDWRNPSFETVILDEVGPLEIKKKQGFHSFLEHIQNEEVFTEKTLIVVVRDYCLQDFIGSYTFENVKVFTENDLRETPVQRPVGIVLCGGRSERMQTDKALLNYHSMPQWKYVFNLLEPFCETVYLSLNSDQIAEWTIPESVPKIVDHESFKNHGPMTGLMTVLERVGERSVFVVACDYPLLRMEHLLPLAKARALKKDVVAYKNNGWPEPLISIFEGTAFPKLKDYFSRGNDSMAKFIRTVDTEYVEVSSPEFLRNVNSREEFEVLRTELKDDKGNHYNQK